MKLKVSGGTYRRESRIFWFFQNSLFQDDECGLKYYLSSCPIDSHEPWVVKVVLVRKFEYLVIFQILKIKDGERGLNCYLVPPKVSNLAVEICILFLFVFKINFPTANINLNMSAHFDTFVLNLLFFSLR